MLYGDFRTGEERPLAKPLHPRVDAGLARQY